MMRALLLASSLFLIGCTRTLRFCVVDAQTGQPLAGVKVERQSGYEDLLFGSYRKDANLGLTDAKGEVTDPATPSSPYLSKYAFTRDGYQPAAAFYALRKGEVDVLTPLAAREGPRYHLSAKDLIRIPLYRYGWPPDTQP